MSKRNFQTGLRVPATFNQKLLKKSKELGISKTALMLMFIEIGYQAFIKNFGNLNIKGDY